MDNNNNNTPVQPGAPKGVSKWGNLLYIIVPVLLIVAIASFVGTQNKTDSPKYYQIVEQFRNGEVSEYSLNLSSGTLKYIKKGEEKVIEYVVPNVDIFLNDVHNYITEYNLSNPDNPIKYDYIKGSNSAVWASVLPSVFMTLLLVGMLFYLYRKMGQSMQNESHHALTFGKARVKLGKDEKRKTTFKV